MLHNFVTEDFFENAFAEKNKFSGLFYKHKWYNTQKFWA